MAHDQILLDPCNGRAALGRPGVTLPVAVAVMQDRHTRPAGGFLSASLRLNYEERMKSGGRDRGEPATGWASGSLAAADRITCMSRKRVFLPIFSG